MQELENTSLSVFWVDADRIDPNPFQPRGEFSDGKLHELAQSIRRHGVLQPLVVTKKENIADSGDMSVRYELIAGERRLRASKIAGLRQVPAVIRSDVRDDSVRLELAIIENLQREDLNPVDRARAFKRLIDEFGMTHSDVAHRMNRSREYISNSVRLLTLPDDMVQAVVDGRITEGHTRSLLMLADSPERQRTLFDDITLRKITVRESETLARRRSHDRERVRDSDPYIREAQRTMEGILDTRVSIQSQGDSGGRIVIDYFSGENLKDIVERLRKQEGELSASDGGGHMNDIPTGGADGIADDMGTDDMGTGGMGADDIPDDEDDMYSFRNFSL